METIKNILETIKYKWLGATGLTILLIVIIIASFVGISIGVDKLNLTNIDLTSEKRYVLTERTKEEIAKIPAEEKIEIYMFDYDEKSTIAELVKQYTKLKDNITLEITTVEDRKDLESKYHVIGDTNTILVVDGEKHKLFTSSDMYSMDYKTGTTIDIAEQRVTNAIISVSSIGESTHIYMLTGHDEYTTNVQLSSFKTYIELENYEINDLNLLVEEKVPEDCEALIVASPQKDFADIEVERIKKYIDEGGNILWMNDPTGNKTELKNIQSVLDLYGVTVHQDGVMFEQDTSRMAMQNPTMIIPQIMPTVITSQIASEGMVLFLTPSKLTFEDYEKLEGLGVSKTDLLTTTEKSFYRTELSATTTTPTGSDEEGSQVLGAILDKKINDEKSSRMVVYANNVFAADLNLTIGQQEIVAAKLFNNMDLILNSVQFLADAEDQITIRKNIEVAEYAATETQNRLVMTIIFGVPLLIILLGIAVWQVRRRKK